MEKVLLTEKTAKALEILKATGAKMTAEDVARNSEGIFATGKNVTAILTHLVKAGHVAKDDEKVAREAVDKDGNKVTRQYTLYFVTPQGAALEYDIKKA